MKNTSNKLEVGVYNAVLGTFGKAGDTDTMMRYFDTMVQSGLKPDIGTFNAILSAYHQVKTHLLLLLSSHLLNRKEIFSRKSFGWKRCKKWECSQTCGQLFPIMEL